MAYTPPYGLDELAALYGADEVWARQGGYVVVRPDEAPHGLLDLPGEWPAPDGIADVDVVRRFEMPVPGLGRRLWPSPLPAPRTADMPHDPADYAARRARHEAAADALAARHPMLAREQRDESSYQWWGLECGLGWVPLLDAVASTIEGRCAITGEPLPHVTQAKEKFGSLRLHLDGADEFALAVADAAEHLSERVCETSGRPGLRGTVGGWHVTQAPGLPPDPMGRGEFVPFRRDGDSGVRLADGTAGALNGLAAARPEIDSAGLPVGWVDLVDVLAGVLEQRRTVFRGDDAVTVTGGRIIAARRGILDELELATEGEDTVMRAAIECFACHMARLTDPATGATRPQG
ncbi:hypothetical protein WDZ11_00270 (plasmid) [Roseomonas mucosa]|uniref:hypothetical protein n=1 Tax=Roseomonas mucosa TaxID=207340 RepID=UPI0030CACA6F